MVLDVKHKDLSRIFADCYKAITIIFNIRNIKFSDIFILLLDNALQWWFDEISTFWVHFVCIAP